MRWGELSTLLAAGALLLTAAEGAVGCNDDGRILWQRELTTDDDDTPPTGGGGDEPAPPPPGGAPPIPCIPGGPEPEPVCICPPEGTCFCEPEGGEQLCELACEQGSCNLTCGAETSCNLDCEVGCFMRCDPFSSCTIGCGGDCVVVCGEGAHCTLWSWDAPSEIYCELGAVCECPILDGCICSGPGCPPPPG